MRLNSDRVSVKTIDKAFDLNGLRLLVALGETRNVSRAADELGMSQSGFSTALARLRTQFGDELFVRTKNGMEPTPRAQTMVLTAREVLEQVRSGILEQPVFDPATARVEFRLSMADVAEVVFLPRLQAHLQAHAPHVTVQSEPHPRDALASRMASGDVDLALGFFPDLELAGYYQQRLYTHTYACMVRPGHPVLRRPMTLQTYASLHHAVVMTPARSDDLFDRFLERQGLKRHVSVRTPHHLSLVAIVAGSDLIATVPLATACYFADLGAVKLLALPFTPPIFNVQQHWHRRSHHEPRTRWLRQQIATLFNDQSDIWQATERGLYGKIRGTPAK